jgi:hypothetical protein
MLKHAVLRIDCCQAFRRGMFTPLRKGGHLADETSRKYFHQTKRESDCQQNAPCPAWLGEQSRGPI